LIDNHIPHVVLIGQSAKELGNNIHTAKVTYANSMEAAQTYQNSHKLGIAKLHPYQLRGW
jgi:hypothetical protein